MKSKKILILILFLIFSSFVIFFYVKKENVLQADSTGWPSVEAVVTLSKVSREWDKSSGAPLTHYKVELKYSFDVEGSTYFGERYAFHKSLIFSTSSDAEKILEDYPLGKKISVYYMPSNPQESVIIR